MATSSDSLLPREHGAYGELVFPMLSALLAGSPRPAAIAFTGGAVLAFLAHEPWLIWTGQRGPRRKREDGARALRLGLGLGALAAALYAAGVASAPAALGPPAIVAVVLGVAGFAVALAHREKTLGGELLAAAALSSAALPVAIAAGLPIGFAAAIVGAWVASFGVGTAAARGIALRLKDAGRSLRIAGASTLVVGIACAAIATTGVAPLRAALAPVPTLLLAIVLVVRPVPVSKIRKVGWAMIAASVVTLGLLVAPIGQV